MTSVCDEPLVPVEAELVAEAELEVPGVEELEVVPGLDDVLDEHAPSPAARRPAATTASIRLLVNGLVDNIEFPLGCCGEGVTQSRRLALGRLRAIASTLPRARA
jgi:hypothetical protein